MNRRHFLTLLGLAAATAAVDPEALIWRPGATTHILPPSGGWKPAPDLLRFHKDAFAFMMQEFDRDLCAPHFEMDAALRAAVNEMADRIDRDIYEHWAAHNLETGVLRDPRSGMAIRFVKSWPQQRLDVLYGVRVPS